MLGVVQFSSTSAKNANASTKLNPLRSLIMRVWASSVSRHRKQVHRGWFSGPGLGGRIRRALTVPYFAQIDSIADLRLGSFRNSGKPFFRASCISHLRGVNRGDGF